MKAVLIVLGSVLLVGLVIMMMCVGYANREVDLRTAIEAKQKDNVSEFDNMFKKIAQVAEVTVASKDALVEIFSSHAKARGGIGENGTVMKWLTESVPNADISTYKTLQNIIVGSRDSWTMRQKELLDLSREHNRLLKRFPSNIVLSMLGRDEIDVTIVTSSHAEEVFETGKDDNVKVF